MVESTEAAAAAARIRTSDDSEVATYLEIAEAREPGQTLTPAPNAPEAVAVIDYAAKIESSALIFPVLMIWNTTLGSISRDTLLFSSVKV